MTADMVYLESVWLHIADAIKDTVDFDGIMSIGFSLQIQRTEDGIVKNVTRISVLGKCK
jgi:hypothetical protein